MPIIPAFHTEPRRVRCCVRSSHEIRGIYRIRRQRKSMHSLLCRLGLQYRAPAVCC